VATPIVTEDVKRARSLVVNPYVPKRHAHRRHRRWSRAICGAARRDGDAEFHHKPFLTGWDVA